MRLQGIRASNASTSSVISSGLSGRSDPQDLQITKTPDHLRIHSDRLPQPQIMPVWLPYGGFFLVIDVGDSTEKCLSLRNSCHIL